MAGVISFFSNFPMVEMCEFKPAVFVLYFVGFFQIKITMIIKSTAGLSDCVCEK